MWARHQQVPGPHHVHRHATPAARPGSRTWFVGVSPSFRDSFRYHIRENDHFSERTAAHERNTGTPRPSATAAPGPHPPTTSRIALNSTIGRNRTHGGKPKGCPTGTSDEPRRRGGNTSPSRPGTPSRSLTRWRTTMAGFGRSGARVRSAFPPWIPLTPGYSPRGGAEPGHRTRASRSPAQSHRSDDK
jgi:hypothetical protein